MIDLTLNGFMIGNMPSFQNAFGTKKTGEAKGCTTAENTVNMMLPFLRMRPVSVTGNTETSAVEADAAVDLSGGVSSLTLGNGAYRGVELTVYNGTGDTVQLLSGDFVIPLRAGDTLELRWNGSEWRVKNPYHAGDILLQYPLEDSPVAKRLEGGWVNWTYRTMLYGIRDTPPPADFIGDWLSKRHDIWHLNTDGSVATQGSKKWGRTGGGMPEGHLVIAREPAVKLTDPDLAEGDQVPAGPYAGWYVWQNIVPAGIFWSVEDGDPAYQGGGLRPPIILSSMAPNWNFLPVIHGLFLAQLKNG